MSYYYYYYYNKNVCTNVIEYYFASVSHLCATY